MLLVIVVIAALLFDYTNGFHDAANAIATSISTRALRPNHALLMAAILNFVGTLLSTSVAATVAKGLVDPNVVTLHTVLAGLLGAIAWNLITWYFGIPSSSSHCLMGGVVGAVLGAYGSAGVKWAAIGEKIILPTLISPIVGFIGGALLLIALTWIVHLLKARPGNLNSRFRTIQTVSAGMMALSHGINDGQKTMGVIMLALVASGTVSKTAALPMWVRIACAAMLGLGTYSGGKRIIKTLGMKLVALRPIDGFAAETAASAVLFATGHFGLPVSTTHVITTTILGVGATKRASAVRWGVTRQILTAWVLTLPASAGIAALFGYILQKVFG